jgi:hypothetical protein
VACGVRGASLRRRGKFRKVRWLSPQLETGPMRGSRNVVGVSVMGLCVVATGGQHGDYA